MVLQVRTNPTAHGQVSYAQCVDYKSDAITTNHYTSKPPDNVATTEVGWLGP